jgi:hypothetical protein
MATSDDATSKMFEITKVGIRMFWFRNSKSLFQGWHHFLNQIEHLLKKPIIDLCGQVLATWTIKL